MKFKKNKKKNKCCYMFHQTSENKTLIIIYSSTFVCFLVWIEPGRYLVGCPLSKLIYFVISRDEKISCCLGLYVSLIDQLWNYCVSSVIQFCVPSSKYLMMVCVFKDQPFQMHWRCRGSACETWRGFHEQQMNQIMNQLDPNSFQNIWPWLAVAILFQCCMTL